MARHQNDSPYCDFAIFYKIVANRLPRKPPVQKSEFRVFIKQYDLHEGPLLESKDTLRKYCCGRAASILIAKGWFNALFVVAQA